jgi:histidine triad (HIT) family protein
MPSESCIFCKIVAKKIPSQFIAETNDIVVIKDINPKASIHYLIIPKEHIVDVASINGQQVDLAGQMLKMAGNLSQQLNNSSFKLVINNGSFQHVPHVHMHFLAGGRIDSV